VVLATGLCMQCQRVHRQLMALSTTDGRGFRSRVIHVRVNYTRTKGFLSEIYAHKKYTAGPDGSLEDGSVNSLVTATRKFSLSRCKLERV